VPEDPDDALPGLTLFLAQRAPHVGEHQQLVREAPQPKGAAAQLPLPGRPGEGRLDGARCLALEEGREAEGGGGGTQRGRRRGRRRGRGEQAFAGAVDQAELALAVEGEDRDVDLGDHLAQQRAGLQGAGVLAPERLGEAVDLGQGFAQGVAAAGDTAADGEVPVAQRAQEVRHGAQRTNDVRPQREGPPQPAADGDRGQDPGVAGGAATGAEEQQRDRDGGQRRQQRQPQHAPLVVARAPVTHPDRCP
jgi:hypothetical protein